MSWSIDLKVNFIGCGRLGKTLAFLLKQTGQVKIQHIVNKNYVNAEKAAAFIGEGRACQNIKQLEPADIYFITTPDHVISNLCNDLLQHNKLNKNNIVVHCSGLFSSELLQPAIKYGCFVGSLHPSNSFADPDISIPNFKNTYCTFEGHEQTYKVISPLIEKAGGIVLKISKDKKALYHAAGVFSANYLVTLFHVATECYQHAGLDTETAKAMTAKLMQNTLTNITSLNSAQKALTGPLSRGDIQTIQKHMESLHSETNFAHLYQLMAKHTLPLTTHSDLLKDQLSDIIDSFFHTMPKIASMHAGEKNN